jgi:two-component system LytT family response regulator
MTATLKAIIVDDEAPARERMVTLLSAFPHIVIAAEAADVPTAAARCADVAPDIVFLDVQLRGESGFDLLPKLTGAPAIIFVTAHDRYAVRAFDVNALDYLLKPVHPARLAAALGRVGTPPADRLPESPLQTGDLVALRDDRGLRLVPLQRITHIESDENYTRVHVAGEAPAFVRRSMIEWHRSLPAADFVRVGRSLIVQVASVREVQAESRDLARVHLAGQAEPLIVARRASVRIRKVLGSR